MKLFEPIAVGGMELKNRIIMPAMAGMRQFAQRRVTGSHDQKPPRTILLIEQTVIPEPRQQTRTNE